MGLICQGDLCCGDEYFYSRPHKPRPLSAGGPREGAELQRGAEVPRLSLGPIKLLRHLVPQTGLTTRAVQIPTQMGLGS